MMYVMLGVVALPNSKGAPPVGQAAGQLAFLSAEIWTHGGVFTGIQQKCGHMEGSLEAH